MTALTRHRPPCWRTLAAWPATSRRRTGSSSASSSRASGLIVEALEVESVGGGAGAARDPAPLDKREVDADDTHGAFFSSGAWHDAARPSPRQACRPGNRVAGPALIVEPHQTIVVEPEWQAEINARDHVVLTRAVPKARDGRDGGTQADPVMLEVFNNLFMSIAEQMGVTLQNTAYSVNIKERLDFSCAVFRADGSLVANAPHMPVHLGSMDRSVETIIKLNAGDIHPGDVFVLNAPYNGGTHLPDITVVTPVFSQNTPSPSRTARLASSQAAAREQTAASPMEKTRGRVPEARQGPRKTAQLLFWVAARGHHADIGGMAPG